MVQFLLSVHNVFFQETHLTIKVPHLDLVRDAYPSPTARFIIFVPELVNKIFPFLHGDGCYKQNLHCGLSLDLTRLFNSYGTVTKRKEIGTHWEWLKSWKSHPMPLP